MGIPVLRGFSIGVEEMDPVAYDNIIVVIYLGLWYPTRSLHAVMLKSFEGKKKKRAAGVFHSKKRPFWLNMGNMQ